MLFRFPIEDVNVKTTVEKKTIEKPSYTNYCVSLNQNEFTLDVAGAGWFYARSGNYVAVMPDENATSSTIDLYLNGSVYGAILHQRKTLPLHGSCFRYKGLGVMLCGESGVGKSSLTTSFCLQGAAFLTDDVTPIVFPNGKPHIWGISDRIKLWSDSLQQLNQAEAGLERIMPAREKFYFPMLPNTDTLIPLGLIIILHVYDKPELTIEPLEGVPGFTALRNEIFRREYLQGMPDTETAYLSQLIAIGQAVQVINVYRPEHIAIEQFRAELVQLIDPLLFGRPVLADLTEPHTL